MKKKANDLYALWSAMPRTAGWLRRLWLTGAYTEEELEEIERIDDEFLTLAREEEAEHRKWMRELSRTDWLSVFPEARHLVKKVSRSQKRFRAQLEAARGVDLQEVVEEYVELRRSGAWRWAGLCPFHEEKSASFVVFTNDDHYYCFGCHEYGDAITFIRRLEELTFKQAVRVLYEYSRQ